MKRYYNKVGNICITPNVIIVSISIITINNFSYIFDLPNKQFPVNNDNKEFSHPKEECFLHALKPILQLPALNDYPS